MSRGVEARATVEHGGLGQVCQAPPDNAERKRFLGITNEKGLRRYHVAV